jgi:uroporphyrinogen decarboxylase
VSLHSCGDVRPFVPELIEIGVDILNPIEVKAGMDPVALKRQYGRTLAFHGGLNAALYPQPEKLYAEMRKVVPEMKKGGGYVISTDHSVPDSVSLEDFRRFVALSKELAAY